MRDLLEEREAAHAVAAELRLHMDVVDDLRREDVAPAEDKAFCLGRDLGAVAFSVFLFAHRYPVSFHASQHQLLLGRLEILVVPQLLPGAGLAAVTDA